MAALTVADLPGDAARLGGDLRVPALVALPGRGTGADGGPGTLLLVHDHRPVVDGDWSGGGALPGDLPNPDTLWLRVSTDAGATWTSPAPLVPAGVPAVTGVSDPSLLVAPDGSVHLLAAASTDAGLFGAHPPTRAVADHAPGQGAEPGTLRLLHAVSHDGGASWSWDDLTDLCLPTPERPGGAVAFPVSGHGAVVRGGGRGGDGAVARLVQPLVVALPARADGSRPVRAVALLSDDDGATWRLGGEVPAPAGAQARSLAGGAATSGVDEWAVAAAPGTGGEGWELLVASARDGGYGGARLSFLSRDGGETWGVPEAEPGVPDPGCNGGLASVPGLGVVLSHACDPSARRSGRLSVLRDAALPREGACPGGSVVPREAVVPREGACPGARAAGWEVLRALTGEGEPFGYSDVAVVRAGAGWRAVVVAEEPVDGPAAGPGAGPGLSMAEAPVGAQAAGAGLLVTAVDLPTP